MVSCCSDDNLSSRKHIRDVMIILYERCQMDRTIALGGKSVFLFEKPKSYNGCGLEPWTHLSRLTELPVIDEAIDITGVNVMELIEEKRYKRGFIMCYSSKAVDNMHQAVQALVSSVPFVHLVLTHPIAPYQPFANITHFLSPYSTPCKLDSAIRHMLYVILSSEEHHLLREALVPMKLVPHQYTCTYTVATQSSTQCNDSCGMILSHPCTHYINEIKL